MNPIPEVGQRVVVRRRPFVVNEVAAAAAGIRQGAIRRRHLVTLSWVNDDGLGEQLDAIWELEPSTGEHEKPSLPSPDRFDHPKRLQAFLDAVRWGAVSRADDRALQSPFRSSVEVEDYQRPRSRSVRGAAVIGKLNYWVSAARNRHMH